MRRRFAQDLRVLVVDDDESIRRVLSVALSVADGIGEIREAESGADALEVSRTFQPDVIFLDYWMPSMDGAVAADHLREICPSAHIVCFSGVLESKPPWADQHYVKGEMPDVEAVLAATR
jgi:CheY-like chemotaxis protein